jgi:hypothetical protein
MARYGVLAAVVLLLTEAAAAGQKDTRAVKRTDNEPIATPAVDIRSGDGKVLIAADRIRSYDWATHTLTLAPKGRDDLAVRLRKGEPTALVTGIPFAVAVGGRTVYTGKFTTTLSSGTIPAPVIVVDLGSLDATLGADQLRIQLGYPGAGVFKGEDPRADPLIRAALQAGGQLAGAQSGPLAVGEWSEPVNGLRGRLLLAQGKLLADGKTRESVAYLDLHYRPEAVGGPLNVHVDPNLRVELRDQKGRPVPMAAMAGSGGRPGKVWQTLPYDCTVRLRLSPYGFGRANGLLIPFNHSAWFIPAGDTGVYSLAATFTGTAPEKHGKGRVWEGTLTLPRVRVALAK